MKMRFTDIDKWKDTWFRRLSPLGKLLYLYVIDNCDPAGFIEIDAPVVILYTKMNVTEKDILNFMDSLEPKVKKFKDYIYYVPNFIRFQYKGELKPNYNPHKAVFKRLIHYGCSIDSDLNIIVNPTLAQGLPKPSRLGLGLGYGLGNGKEEERDAIHSRGF